MKRTDKMTKLISILLFTVLVLYVGTYFIRYIGNDLRSAPVVSVSITDSTPASGIVVREETIIRCDEPYLSIHVPEGRMLSAGGIIALAYKGEDAMQRAGRIKDLEREKYYITSVLSRSEYSKDLSEREGLIEDTLTELSAASARHEADRLSNSSITLETLVLDKNFDGATQADLDAVNDELYSLQQNAVTDTKAIRAETSGLFTSATDGYEHLAPDTILTYYPDDIHNVEATSESATDNAIGKLVNPNEWYFAAVLSEDDAKKLEIDSYSTLDFGRYSSQLINAKVVNLGPPFNGEQVVLFRCTSDISGMLSARRVNAEIVYASQSGLRIQKEAVYPKNVSPQLSDSSENTEHTEKTEFYVYTLTGIRAEKKYLNIIYESDDYYLAEPSDKGPMLREGNDIIISDTEPEDNQIMREA